MKQFTVMGNPIEHSLSPLIHRAFAKQHNIALEYDKTHVLLGAFPATVRTFFSSGGHGINVTAPFKREAYAMADIISDRARQASSVNVLYLNDNQEIVADNTDNIGFLIDFVKHRNGTIKDKNILVIGAGAVAKGLLPALLQEIPKHIYMINRNQRRAQEVAQEHAGDVTVLPSFELIRHQFDIIIHASAAGLDGTMPILPDNFSANGAICYDVCYGSAAEPFLNWANQHGASATYDGLGMLVEQAAESFLLWHGVRPDTRSVIELLTS